MSTIDSSATGEERETEEEQDQESVSESSPDAEVSSKGVVSDILPSADSANHEMELSRDLVFDVLKNRRRRYALHYLKQQEGSVKLSDLAEQVAAWENDTTIGAISAAERKRVYTALYQSHLPKLDDAGIVEYNQNRGLVELSEAAEQLDVYLELVSQDDIPWSKYYLGLAIAGLGVVTAAWLQLPPFSFLSDTIWAVLIVAAFMISAAAHTYYTRYHRIGSTETPPEIDN